MNSTGSSFVYVTYIRTTPERLWQALTEPEFTRQFWADTVQDCDWKVGSSWKLMIPDGRVADAGEVLEIEPHRRLVLSWQNQFKPELKAEGFSRLVYSLEQQGEMVKLTVTHQIGRPGSQFIEKVSGGWPIILSSLKSLLETGESLEATRRWPEGI
ncbi:MAG TPA: SRPBCC family protein [Xanthobacteraceae bacterium]|jgi:uncharacterized protein YndB with AHSA1/START domain|nr:SRPBCC family protein [Xanthobacteraceae bacterium]